jgi:hypothetical protein
MVSIAPGQTPWLNNLAPTPNVSNIWNECSFIINHCKVICLQIANNLVNVASYYNPVAAQTNHFTFVCCSLIWLSSLLVCRQGPCDNPKVGLWVLHCVPPRIAPHQHQAQAGGGKGSSNDVTFLSAEPVCQEVNVYSQTGKQDNP